MPAHARIQRDHGLHRGVAPGVEDLKGVDVPNLHGVGRFLRQWSMISSIANTFAGNHRPTNARTHSFFRSSTMYSTGDLPSIRANISIRSNRPIRADRSALNRPARPARYAAQNTETSRRYSSRQAG